MQKNRKMSGRVLLFLIVLLVCSLASCKKTNEDKAVTLQNTLDFDRKEVVTIKIADLAEKFSTDSHFAVKDGDKELPSQLLDSDQDSIADELLFYVEMKAGEKKTVAIKMVSSNPANNIPALTYGRFVPERIDDYAWENDLVAFRTYGPEAQRLVDEGKEGGTLSSGMDCWLKRVNYSVIDKWYKKYTEGGTYHKDDGEGYDPYHVGKSRGCGGIGVWKNDSLYVSKNFVTYKKIANGPVRTIFELQYAPWMVDKDTIYEKKRITIDPGNQLYRIDDIISSSSPIPNCTIGITLHEKAGETFLDSANGVFAYWEPIDDSEIGTGIVIDQAAIQQAINFRTAKKDLSHILIVAKPADTVTYYPGFAWRKAGAITTPEAWVQYLNQFSQRLKSPILVSFE
jgi:hypothetical protein